jgi:DNA helicase II / ATP-dependent DNA helicase PcrA
LSDLQSNFHVLLDNGFPHIFEAISKVEMEARQLKPNAVTVVHLRTALEDLLDRIKPLGEGVLFDKIKILKKKWPGCWVLSAMHQIRTDGNQAAHDVSFSISQDALIDLLYKKHEIIRWFFEDIETTILKETLKPFYPTIYKKHLEEKTQQKIINSFEDESSRVNSSHDSKKLNDEQKKIAEIKMGRHFVNASPGTGKTELISHRLNMMVGNFRPEEIVCLTFTNRAANEMKERVELLFSSDSDELMKKMFVGNIHAFCKYFLDESGIEAYGNIPINNLTLLDDVFKRDFENSTYTDFVNQSDYEIEKLITQLYNSPAFSDNNENLKDIKLIFSDFNNSFIQKGDIEKDISPEKFKSDFFIPVTRSLSIAYSLLNETDIEKVRDIAINQWEENVDRFYSKTISIMSYPFDKAQTSILIWSYLTFLTQTKRNIKCYDFDDLISLGLTKLIKKKKKYKCIQVDEVQDLNLYQWAIIEAVASENSTVMALGDNDQSIYKFLGANNDLLRKFTASFDNHSLTKNYRAVKPLVELLNSYRKINFFDSSTPMKYSGNKSTDESAAILVQYANRDNEIEGCINAAKKILNTPQRSVGVLLRYNKKVDEYASSMEKNNLKVFRVSDRDIMKHEMVVDFISLIRAYNGKASRLDWYRLVYRFSKRSGSSVATRKNARDFVNELLYKGISPKFILPIEETNDESICFDYSAKEIVRQARNGRIVVFDTETTGVDTKSAVLLQLAAVVIEKGKIVDEFNEFIQVDHAQLQDPEFIKQLDISSKIHHIDSKKLESKGQPSKSVFENFLKLIGDENTILIAHNLPYDLGVLSRNIDINGIPNQLEKFLRMTNSRAFDSLTIARDLYPEQPSHKLGKLISAFNLEGVNSHDALDDVKATSGLVMKMVNDIEKRLDETDSILNKYPVFSISLQKHAFSLFKLFSDQDVNFSDSKQKSNQTSLTHILHQWLDYALNQSDWYNINTASIINSQINEKLVPWLDKNFKKGRLSDVFDPYVNPFNQLEMASEVDLIDTNRDRVVVSTIHRAKGLQFETVIVPEVIDDVYPGFYAVKNNNEEQIEEDKRLLYVAISRPTHKLIVTTHKKVYQYEKSLSRFLSPIQQQFKVYEM